jgi:virulence-associated protein VagC
MTIARVIQTGKTQTVELPEDVRLSGERVEVLQHNNEIILREVKGLAPGQETDWAKLFEALADLGEAITEVPDDPPPEDRPDL